MPQVATENTLDDLEKQVDGLIKELDGVLKAGKGPKTDDADMTSGGEKIRVPRIKNHTNMVGSPVSGMVKVEGEDDGSVEDVTKRLEKASEILGISPAELGTMLLKASNDDDGDGADDDDDDDDTGKDNSKTSKRAAENRLEMAANLLGVSKEDLSPVLAKSLGDDDTVVIEGERINKADVGEAVFNVLKKQSEKIAKSAEDLTKAQSEAEIERLKKRAGEKFPHVPGSVEERAEMLKSIEHMPEKLKKSFEKVLENSEKITKGAFEQIGVNGGDPADLAKTSVDFNKKVDEIASRDKISKTEAMAKARRESPELFKAFNGN